MRNLELAFVYSKKSYVDATADYERFVPPSLAKRLGPIGVLLARMLFVSAPLLLLAAYTIAAYLSGLEVVYDNRLILLVVCLIFSREIRSAYQWLFGIFRPAKAFDADPRWQSAKRWTITDEGILIASFERETLTRWIGIERVCAGKSTYLFFEKRVLGPNWLYLPHDALASSEDRRLFEQIAQTHCRFERG